MLYKICRRTTSRAFVFLMVGLTVIVYFYYANYVYSINQSDTQDAPRPKQQLAGQVSLKEKQHVKVRYQELQDLKGVCPAVLPSDADIDTVSVYKDFDFQPTWMKSKEYWDKSFEERYEKIKTDPQKPSLKVFIVPHSHNDPGWLKTFEQYFNYQSRKIINHMVTKLQQYKNLTFIWSEVAFLNAWWEGAHPSKRRALKSLVESGRLEITTGGWVMTDEANTHIYAMLDQLIEGHQWLLANLNVKPRSGWSIDPFGHGSTNPYILAASGISGTVIQRIHYAWKQWLASKQSGDFKWVPSWQSSTSILTHNQPFDIYSIKHSCGPHPYICLNFDFRKVYGEYTEFSIKAQAITDKNVREKSELLLEQYARTGSLFSHNVVLIPLGDDFRYNVIEEWDQQYTNYLKLINYINEHKEKYNTEISFGTPFDYFEEVRKRQAKFPTLKGDFFVYSDIFSEGRPAYWSGYFTTRPFMKILDRELENNLRTAEILFSIAFNSARQRNLGLHLKIFERDFEKLVNARRNLGLFQHHDAITGTSKSFVMRDYGLKLFESIRGTITIQQNAIQSLLFQSELLDRNLLVPDSERDSFEKIPRKIPITVKPGQTRQIVVFNSLAQPQDYFVQVRVSTFNVEVFDVYGEKVVIQVNPVWNNTNFSKMFISDEEYELTFIAHIPALTVITYNVTYSASDVSKKLSTIYCNNCQRIIKHGEPAVFLASNFTVRNTKTGDVQLENHKFKLLFNGNSGFLKTVTRKHENKIRTCAIQFGAYRSAQYHSGAYLFMPDPNEREIEKDVLQQYKDQTSLIITSGPVSSELTVIYGPFLVHTVRIYHVENSTISNGVYVENEIDFESPPKNRETELFMRVVSDVQNGDLPELYTDLNGFQMQKRVKIERIGIEGNYFPITTMAFIQDDEMRLSLLTNHAQGASSWQPGFLEVMLDRRTLYDDSRGMGEGLVDNRKTLYKFWLLFEDVKTKPSDKYTIRSENDEMRRFNVPTEFSEADREVFTRPSLFSNHMSNSLNYPVNIFVVDNENAEITVKPEVRLIGSQFPCDVHLLTLRTQSENEYFLPSPSSLLVLHRQGYDCGVNGNYTCDMSEFSDNASFNLVKIKHIQLKTLTGTETLQDGLKHLVDLRIRPMELQTLNITFA